MILLLLIISTLVVFFVGIDLASTTSEERENRRIERTLPPIFEVGEIVKVKSFWLTHMTRIPHPFLAEVIDSERKGFLQVRPTYKIKRLGTGCVINNVSEDLLSKSSGKKEWVTLDTGDVLVSPEGEEELIHYVKDGRVSFEELSDEDYRYRWDSFSISKKTLRNEGWKIK